ncbi:MAG: homocysteine S-methyltransferase [Actinomyces sp.]|uniref:homocysteine S-methyltransferase n=1 Tax=Actinomyces sp. TaxID=29317 RepID=UPI0026DCF44B|nr:homocysteine S-methyltransferase [Actinomyces sp.]MDO4243370.1 homocysteine S-methyltransferase [Actinomyces sp.]
MRTVIPDDGSHAPGLAELLSREVLVLDGAMGTELDARGVDTRHALWSARALVEDPEAVAAVHADYVAAGARVLTTNSYQATVPAFERAGLGRAAALQALETSARLAQEAAAEAAGSAAPVLVAGGLGPYGAYLADGSEYIGAYSVHVPDFEQVHRPCIEALASQGLRLFALETIPRLDEARAVLDILTQTVPDAECWVSFQVRADGRTLADGTPLAAAAAWADRCPAVSAVGLNCVPPPTVARALPVLGAATRKPLVAYPNSGDVYDPATKSWQTAQAAGRFTAGVPAWIDAGLRLVGGCCRTGPADTAVLARAVAGLD